jgi:hypothetical protein
MADFDPTTTETEDEEYPPLGLTNPLLPPEPLGQEPLYPQFLMPVAAAPIMAVNPSMFFPEGIPGYQVPDNPFQESPFFAAARASLRTGQALVLPEVLQEFRRVPRPILSDLLGDLEPQTDFEAPAASPEPTTNEIEVADVPTLEDFEVVEEQEIQPVPPEEVALPPIPEIEAQELVETLPTTELSSSYPEVSSNPLSIPAVSEANYVADTSPAEPIAAESALQETELVEPEPTVAFSSVSEELGSPVVPQTQESPAETEPPVVPELPELIEQPKDVEVTVSPKAELSEETEIPEPITANSSPPELAEILTESAAENSTPESEPLPITPTTASSVMSDLEQTAPEPEEVPESSELAEVQNEPEVVEALEPTTPEPENTELIEIEAAVSPESELLEGGSLLPVGESTAEENESLPALTNEAPVFPTEEAAAEIVELPISNPELITAEIEEPASEELVGAVAESPPLLAEAELTSPTEAETPPSMAVAAEIEPVAELENTEELPNSQESIVSPVEVIPEGEPLAAEQNQSEEAVAAIAEPLTVTFQEMVAPEAEQNPENQPESESSPPISRIQALIEQQIETFSGLEQEEFIEEEASTASESVVPLVMEEGAQPASIEENIPSEIPPEVATTEMAAPSLEIPIVTESESAPLQSEVELPVAQTEANVEAVLSLPTILENLGILTPLSTLSPLTQLANFLPIPEPFALRRREGIPLGLEQPMTFASPPVPASPLTQLANFLPVAEPFASEQREGIPLGLEQPMTFASITPPPSLESRSLTTPNNEESSLPPIRETRSSTADSSTETESSTSQEENLSFSEAMNSLPVVSTLPVMRNDGIFTPLTFAQRSINNTPINEQERGSSDSLSTLNIPQEWSSIEEFINSNPSIERDEFNSLFSPEVPTIDNEPEGGGYTSETSNFMSSSSSENDEEQNFISDSISLDDMDESMLNLEGEEDDEDTSLDERNEDTRNEIDLEILAKEIYSLLQQRLVIERERRGYYSGRLPW